MKLMFNLDPLAIGLDLLFGTFFSAVGLCAFIFGKKRDNRPYLVIGILLMVLPMFLWNPWMLLGVCTVVSYGLIHWRHA